ncbi:Hypothetical protein A7982_05162 [Minicystis rosea]|nr:Hypothetical protein A7982_05162 [Minicystis rosea]
MSRRAIPIRCATVIVLLSTSLVARADLTAPPSSASATASAAAPPASSAAPPASAKAPAASASSSASPPSSASPTGSARAPLHGLCDEKALAWAKGASTRIGREIEAVACPAGLVRLRVAGAGCDYEVNQRSGFARTADGAFSVSPIVDLDWATAPEPMRKGLSDILTALTQDPSLRMGTGEAAHRADQASVPLQRPVYFAVGAALLSAGALAFWLSRRRSRANEPAPKPDA